MTLQTPNYKATIRPKSIATTSVVSMSQLAEKALHIEAKDLTSRVLDDKESQT